MYKRLNITLPGDLLARVDEFARRQRYTRSGLIAAALEAFVGPHAPERVEEAPVAYRVPPRPQLQRDEVARLLGAFFAGRDDVDAAWVFGSVARGDVHEFSDLDVAVLPAGELSATQRGALGHDVSVRLERVLGVERVDVIIVSDAPARLARTVVVEGVVVHGEGTRALAEAEIAALRASEDFGPVAREITARVKEVASGYARL